jgi:hypothetical protein
MTGRGSLLRLTAAPLGCEIGLRQAGGAAAVGSVARTCHTVLTSGLKPRQGPRIRVVPLSLRCSINPTRRENGAMWTAGKF